MASELADLIDGTPGRFVPQEMRGELVEAEHLTRYRWAATLAAGARVLDAGCGVGYGTASFAEAGATDAVGVDIAPEAIEAARADANGAVRYEVGDVRDLPFPDDSFDLVVCFEVIEHIDDQERALDELRRVVAGGGVIAVSSPNPEVYVPGNPHHKRELRPDELTELMQARFRNVRQLGQRNHVATSVIAEGSQREGARIDELESREAPVYSIAAASDAPLPEFKDVVSLASPVDVRAWVERFAAQQEHIHNQAVALDELRRRADTIPALQRRVAETEAAAAEVLVLRARIEEILAAVGELERARAVIRDLQSSLSWRITAPLRSLKHRTSKSRSPDR